MTDATIITGEDSVTFVQEPSPPSEKMSPGEWVSKRLFSTPLNGVLTAALGALAIFIGFRLLRFVFVTGRWEPVRQNFELFMIGLFPREERWRIIGQLLLTSFGIGLLLGSLRSGRRDVAEDTGEPFVTESWRTYLGSYWSIVLFVGLTMLAFARSTGPWLLLVASIVLAVVGWAATGFLPRVLRAGGWTLAALAVIVGFQFLSGTGGWAWFFTALAFVPIINDVVGRLSVGAARNLSATVVALAGVVAVGTVVSLNIVVGVVAILVVAYAAYSWLQGDRLDAMRIGLVPIVGAIVYGIYRAIGLGGVDWRDWGGFHLSLVVTVCAIALAFPVGVLLALGRRSTLPVVRVICVAYIEFFRGAPLITFLLAGQFFLGFFLNTDSPLSLITRSLAAITLFSAAYIAEIIRGGLQAVPKGQVEAGQASGLSPTKITRLIVMPQALRAVIPAMVGQFISLFKDTSLLSIVTISEFLDVRLLVHAQEAFRGFGIAETLTFVAFGYWAFSFAMSRESQRLERRLGVGQR